MFNFAITLFGKSQQIILNADQLLPEGIPSPSQLLLYWSNLAECMEHGELNIFRALRWNSGLAQNLHGRQDDLSKIVDWAESGPNLPTVRLIAGPGGVGKSRLAAAAAACLKSRGWSAGFVPREETFSCRVNDKGLFLIIDYPEEQIARTIRLLSRLADVESPPYPIRVLLLSRHGFADWNSVADILGGRFGRQEIARPTALSITDAAKMYDEAASQLSTCLGKDKPSSDHVGEWLALSDVHRFPLFVLAGAIHSVLSPEEGLGLSGSELLDSLARRERRRASGVSRSIGLGNDGLSRLLALGVLGNGLSERSIRELGAAGVCNEIADIVALVEQTSWWSGGRLARLEPDALAAAFLNIVLFGQSPATREERLEDWLVMALTDEPVSLEQRLGRLLFDLKQTRPEYGDGHPLEMQLSRGVARSPMLADRMSNAYRHTEGVLAGATPVAHIMATAFLSTAKRTNDPVDRSTFLQMASVNLHSIGRYDASLEATEESVRLCRELVRDQPDKYNGKLANHLNTLATRLSRSGDLDGAIRAAEEAVRSFRVLARVRPRTNLPYLAGALMNLANIRARKAQAQIIPIEDALDAAAESVAIRQELFIQYAPKFRLDLARSLESRGRIQSQCGRHAEALRSVEDALAHYRALAENQPERYGSELARGISSCGLVHFNARRLEAAATAVEQAISTFRELSSVAPEAYLARLASELFNLARVRRKLSDYSNALEACREAAAILRNAKLSEQNSADLISGLQLEGDILKGIGDNAAAESVIAEAKDLAEKRARRSRKT